MRTRARIALTLGAATVAAGLTAVPAHAAGATYYVDITNKACSDGGGGTVDTPFCNIQAGVDAASPGDTVEVMKPSVYGSQGYKQPVTISRSGTAQAPINIVASQPSQQVDSSAPYIFETTGAPAFTFNGASNIRLDGFPILNYTGTPLIEIQSSSNITVDTIGYTEGSGDITVDGASSGITISRSILGGISVGAGASNISLIENSLTATAPIAATSVNGLIITNNTIVRGCPSGIDVEGTSANVSIENNVVGDDWGFDTSMASGGANCALNSTQPPNVGEAPEITVSAGSAPNTTTDYNDIFTWQSNRAPSYSWGGVVYQTPRALTQATGQASHDVSGNPCPAAFIAGGAGPLSEGSPSIDSGNANAPGILPTDLYGNPRVDDQYVPNTGVGASPYVDRGAFEYTPPAGAAATVTVTPTSGTYPLTVTVSATPPTGWNGPILYSYNFNDGSGWTPPAIPTSIPTLRHTYNAVGTFSANVDVRETVAGATTTAHDSQSITVTPSNAPLVPVLNLRNASSTTAPVAVTADASGTTGRAPIASYSFDFGDGSAPVVVPASTGTTAVHPMPIGTYTVTMTATDVLGDSASISQQFVVATINVPSPSLTVTEGTPVGGKVPVTLDPTGTTAGAPITSYSFDFGDGTGATVVNAATAAPITRLLPLGLYPVTLTVRDALNRTGTVTKNVAVGAGYQPYGPQRIMDTRKGIGVEAGAVPGLGTLQLKLPQALLGTADSPTIAVVLNVTVTAPLSGGYLTVYPGGSTRPNSSNLNFSAGESVPNQVTVPVNADGTVDFYLGSGGSAQLIADVEGFYTLGTGTGYTGVGPTRVLDTRSGLGGAGGRVAGGGTLTLSLPTNVVPANASAVLMNVTAVNPSGGGYLTVYPDGGSRPTSSDLDFPAHDTVANLVVVPVTDGKIDFYLGSAGSADLVADVAGYYSASSTSVLLPFFPTRLVDTRQNGALPAGTYGTLDLATALNVPSTLLSAALYNVTVTRPQTSGYLTVYPDGLSAMPKASNLNFAAGQTIPNAVLSPLLNGGSDFYNGSGGQIDVIVDLFGVFAPAIAPSGTGSSSMHAGALARHGGVLALRQRGVLGLS